MTDGLPAIALGLEPAEKGIMNRPPRSASEGVFSNGLLSKILFRGCLIGLTTLFVFSHFLQSADLATARTAALLTLVLTQLIHVFECKSEEKGLLHIPFFNNKKLLAAAAVSAGIAAVCLGLNAVFLYRRSRLLAAPLRPDGNRPPLRRKPPLYRPLPSCRPRP